MGSELKWVWTSSGPGARVAVDLKWLWAPKLWTSIGCGPQASQVPMQSTMPISFCTALALLCELLLHSSQLQQRWQTCGDARWDGCDYHTSCRASRPLHKGMYIKLHICCNHMCVGRMEPGRWPGNLAVKCNVYNLQTWRNQAEPSQEPN